MGHVAWKSAYDIDLKGVSSNFVYHMREALKQHLSEHPNIPEEDQVDFSALIHKCEMILQWDERD